MCAFALSTCPGQKRQFPDDLRARHHAMGLAGLVMLPFGIAAPLAIGRLRDTSGSFDSALLLLIGAYCLSAAVLALLPRRAAVGSPAAQIG